MIEGVEIKLGDKTYVVPALNFKLLKKHKADIEVITSATPDAGLDTEIADRVVKVVHAALTRNYPNITLDEIEDGLDLRNNRNVMGALLGQSGFVAAGESKALPASADQSTGTTSTGS
jgi:hypothetical protein